MLYPHPCPIAELVNLLRRYVPKCMQTPRHRDLHFALRLQAEMQNERADSCRCTDNAISATANMTKGGVSTAIAR